MAITGYSKMTVTTQRTEMQYSGVRKFRTTVTLPGIAARISGPEAKAAKVPSDVAATSSLVASYRALVAEGRL